MKHSSLQYITQSQKLHLLEEEMKRILDYGVQWIQLRIKNYDELNEDKFYGFYEKCGEMAFKTQESFDSTFIINDNVRLCQHLDADGIHLGKKDLDLTEARRLLGEKIIGATANSRVDVDHAIKKQADYIGLGPLRETSTKKNLDSFLGFEGYETILEQPIDVPIVAIGGITEADCLKLKEIGLNGIAVSSLLYNNGSQEMVTRINKTFNL